MYGVVNRLTFADPVDARLAARLRDDAMPRIAAVGCRDAYVVQTGAAMKVLVAPNSAPRGV